MQLVIGTPPKYDFASLYYAPIIRLVNESEMCDFNGINGFSSSVLTW